MNIGETHDIPKDRYWISFNDMTWEEYEALVKLIDAGATHIGAEIEDEVYAGHLELVAKHETQRYLRSYNPN